MKKILHTLLFMSAIQFTNAQYVAIPDSGFRVWLNNNGYSACMSGNNLDTNCAALASVTILSFYAPSPPINDYTGLQYFKNMLHLAFFQITANKIPLPPNLTYLSIFFDTSLVSIPSLPDSITFLQIENTDITQLPPLPSALWIIYCGDNLLTSLPPLPASLHQLECVDNQITSLPSLPGGLDSLYCSNNLISVLPPLPDVLWELYCNGNIGITCFPDPLHDMDQLVFYGTSITCVPNYASMSVGVTSPQVSLHFIDTNFTEIRNDSLWLLGRVNNNYVAVLQSCNGYIDSIRACNIPNGQAWVIMVGDSETYGSFDTFQQIIDSSQFVEQWYYDTAAQQEIFYAQIIIDSINISYSWGVDSTLPTGIANINPSATFNIFPNPANATVNIELTNMLQSRSLSGGRLEIYNTVGQLVYQTEVTDKLMTIPTRNFSEGIYAVRLSTDMNSVDTRCFVVSH